MSKTVKWTREQLNKRYEDKSHKIHVKAVLTRELVGGQPADQAGTDAFVKFQAGPDLSESERAAMAARIMREEIGERDVNTDAREGLNLELNEKLIGQVNVLRHDKHGYFLGDWMAKANLKTGASRLGLWQSKKGLKGDMSELGAVRAAGISLKDKDNPWKIYVVGSDGKEAETFWQTFRGRIQSPSGPASIVTNSECLMPGSLIEFVYFFLGEKMSEEDAADLVSSIGVIGLGSSRAMERGRFEVLSAEYVVPDHGFRSKKEDKKEEKKAKAA